MSKRAASVDDPEAQEVLSMFEAKSRLGGLGHAVLDRSDGRVLFIELGCPSERFFKLVADVNAELSDEHPFKGRITLRRVPREPWIRSPEAELLRQVLSESLTVDRHTFANDFFSLYIKTVVGAESQIEAAGNHVVFGRRGSGKSSLLVYAMRRLDQTGRPFAWVDMQTYERRDDVAVIAEVLQDVVRQLPTAPGAATELLRLLEALARRPQARLQDVRALAPQVRRLLSPLASRAGGLTIFLDDLHVIDPSLQPQLLSALYAASRGNRVYMKVSAIEHFSRIWDPTERLGLEPTNDAQVIRLDYNLTDPEKSREHIASILDAHARHCGLPSISTICPRDSMSRLVWVAAGVPRDAINIFSQAMGRAMKKEKAVGLTSINIAASQAAEDKRRYVELDTSGASRDALDLLEQVKNFCIRQQKKNAFLVQIRNDSPTFEALRKLIDLRFLHVLNPGITPSEAGERWMAVMLDYGFYTGVRPAKIDLFQEAARTPEVKELRKLPRFTTSVQTSGQERRPPGKKRSRAVRAKVERS